MQNNILQIFATAIFFFLSLSALAEPNKEEFERQVEIEKTEMHSDKSAVEAAYAFLQKPHRGGENQRNNVRCI